MYSGKAINIWANCTAGVHFSVIITTKSSLVFIIPECLGTFIFKFVGRVFGDGLVNVCVY